MDRYIGKRLDSRYEIYDLLGIGGMSYVYKAHDIKQNTTVALKILRDEFSQNCEFIRRFRTESKAVKLLSHKNIIKIFDVNIGSKIQYIVMEYIEGKTLKEYIKNQKEISILKSLDIIINVLNALKHSHDNGVIHRDIKPQNIMILNDDEVKVMDFGIARFVSSETKTLTDKSLGSVHYVSPEQARGNVIDIRSDIYSVGIILYEILTNKLPFEAENDFLVALMQMKLEPQKPSLINKNIPPVLENIILKSMKKNADDRYQLVDQMIDDIKKFIENSNEYSKNQWLNDIDIQEEKKQINSKKYNSNENVKPIKNKKKAVFIAGGVFVTFVLFTLILMFMTMFTSYGLGGAGRSVDIPDFVGMHLSDIQKGDYNFHWKVESAYDPYKPQGLVLAQEPMPGSKKVNQYSTIMLKVNSSGVLVEVPLVSKLSKDVAVLKLINAGLKSEIRAINDDVVPIDNVIYSDPPEGTKIMIDSTIVLYVSKGPVEPMVSVPDVIKKSISEAKDLIINSKLKILPDIRYEKSDLPKDTVISTDPLPGISVKVGSNVEIIASSGVKKDKVIELQVLLPKTQEAINLSVYVDGTHQQEVRVDPAAIGFKKFQFSGNKGEIEVRIKINDRYLYRVYKINFDELSVKLIESYDYPL